MPLSPPKTHYLKNSVAELCSAWHLLAKKRMRNYATF